MESSGKATTSRFSQTHPDREPRSAWNASNLRDQLQIRGRHEPPETIANASIPTPQPVHGRPMFGAFGGALKSSSITFVSNAAYKLGVAKKYGLQKIVAPVKGIRKVRKQHMVLNGYMPYMEIDAETYEVRADGQLLICEPAKALPMAQRYFLF